MQINKVLGPMSLDQLEKVITTMDEQFMQRALELAELGRGTVSPNPMVGCVIVHDGKIIGEGWHRKYGEAHAEVNAINSVEDESLLPESTCYVTLEPCSHHGKTPPCADLLVSKKVKRVVIAAVDSNPLVGGKGVEKLKAAGIEVVVGLFSESAIHQNIRFFTMIERQRPYIILKWAQTSDGFVARENFDSKWISNPMSRSLVHQWRAEEDAILVGANTATYDNPRLNVRGWSGKNPLRVLIDRNLRVDQSSNLFDGSIPTVVYNHIKSEQSSNLEFVKLEADNFLSSLLNDLHKRKIQSIIIEGGSAVLNLFIEAGLWDEARVFTAGVSFGAGISAPRLNVKELYSKDILRDKLTAFRNNVLFAPAENSSTN
jgi:diaminohydroxyphosphoribosylaminopyrimidine deaminase/5-amino-6-(5-phosphoribosylamino)uracil reductase